MRSILGAKVKGMIIDSCFLGKIKVLTGREKTEII